MTRYLEESPTLEWIESSGVLDATGTGDYADGNLEGSVTQFQYLDGNIAPTAGEGYNYETFYTVVNPPITEGMTFNFPKLTPQQFLFDGNLHLIDNTILGFNIGDGNVDFIEGNGPSQIALIYEASLATGDIYDGKYVFRFDEFLLFQDGSYVHFGPTTKKNISYPLFRNLIFIEDEFENTVELGGYFKAGYLDETTVWPPVVANITSMPALKGGPIEKVNDLYKDRYGVNATPLLVGSTNDDGTGQIYVNGIVVGYTRDYNSIAYDPTSDNFLYTSEFSTVVETLDGKNVYLKDHSEAKLKGLVLYNGSHYWCVMQYISKSNYNIVSMTLNIGDIDDILNKDIFPSTKFNKQKTT